MKFAIVLAVLAFLAVGALADASDVVVLGEDFTEKTADGVWLVEFYAPWCGYCKKLAPIWEELATLAKTNFNVAKVDCTAEGKTACSEMEVKGYPTVKLLVDGVATPYKGARELPDFIKFVEANTDVTKTTLPGAAVEEAAAAGGPAEKEGDVVILTVDNFAETTKDGEWLIEFYAPWCGHCKRLVPIWAELATKASDFNVAKVDCTENRDLATKYGVRGFPTIKLFEDGDFKKDYSGARTVDGFSTFMEESRK
eukprot:TRINITY_DN16734_c2_g1_i1.p1 TRINITY_DN16734_c2_g1~~TRINITY_DN16734_c2_g1_i1.p1  ORF type:complete len:266 (+),score=93.02 TRINITY_DN16734_c2_g1_i1:39-800(+)